MSEKDVKDASAGVLQDLKRFQKDKEMDLRRYMVGLFSPELGLNHADEDRDRSRMRGVT